MKISQEGIDLIKKYEGCKLTAYKAVSTEKYYTIGYGHYGADVKKDQVITQKEADDLLINDLAKFEKYVNDAGLNLKQCQFDALVSFTYNCGAGNLRKLIADRSLDQIADAMLKYNKSGNKELAGLTRRRKEERELFLKEDVDMNIMIGSARIDENGKTLGGKNGDQKQTDIPDNKGEVSLQKFYVHSKGWYVFRAKKPEHAKGIATSMERACNNSNIGYDQSKRLEIIKNKTTTGIPTSCDCSSLVRQCILEATGIDPGNFTTANEPAALEKTGLFEDKKIYKAGAELCTGDILVTRTKGHTAIVTSGTARTEASGMDVCPYELPAITLKYTMQGTEVKWLQWYLNKFGYNLSVDGIFGKKTLTAVKDFQKSHGLVVDGLVGKLTKTELKKI